MVPTLLMVTARPVTPTLPFVSVARAVMVWVPLVSAVVSMLAVQLLVPVATWEAPLSKLTLTWAMPALPWAWAVPETVIIPETVPPLAGWVMLTAREDEELALPGRGTGLAVAAPARSGRPYRFSMPARTE